MEGKGRLPSPGTAIGLVALFVALGGTAVALEGRNRVLSDDIKNGQVKTPDLHKGAVNPKRADLTKVKSAAGEATTTSDAPADLGGPRVKVKVPKGALVAIHAQVEGRITGGGGNEAGVWLDAPGILPNPAQIMTFDTTAFQARYTAPGDGVGVTSKARGGWLVLSSPPGKRTFQLRYNRTGGTAIFRDRKLSVTVIG